MFSFLSGSWIFFWIPLGSVGQLSYINFLRLIIVDAIEAALYHATEEALATIGESTRHAFLWHLHHERIPYSHDAMDMGQIESKLRQFFGVASPVIIQMIYEKFIMRAAREGYFSADMIPMLDKLPRNSNTDTIMRLVTKHHNSR